MDDLLTELTPAEISQAKRDSARGQIVQTDPVLVGARAQLKKDIATIQPRIDHLTMVIKQLLKKIEGLESGSMTEKQKVLNRLLGKVQCPLFVFCKGETCRHRLPHEPEDACNINCHHKFGVCQ